MKIAIDIEADALEAPKHIWVIVCKDIDSGVLSIFRNVTEDADERARWEIFAGGVKHWVGHNFLEYDYPVLNNLLGYTMAEDVDCTDTLIISKLIDYPRSGHSIESYGEEFGLPKGRGIDFSHYSSEMEEYCVRDVEICLRIYTKYKRYLSNPDHRASILLEHRFQNVANSLHRNGFFFNHTKASRYLVQIEELLKTLDKEILDAFPPKLRLIREITPKETKYGTLSKTDFRWLGSGDITEYNGGPFCRCSWESFNPNSHKQIIAVLSAAGWRPTDRTQTHIDTERAYAKIKNRKGLDKEKKETYDKLILLRQTGWKVNETNLETLPNAAPRASKLLAKRILLESRRRTLTEWLELVHSDGRIHGRFYAIGAWTHRMAHQNPNTANIPNEFDTAGKRKLLGKELRSLWCAPRNRLLVGVDAEGIQLRIFAHYINDPEFTKSLIEGKKDDKTDPHSLNQRILGSVCRTRAAAKRFIYALLLGAGMGKLSEILGCSDKDTRSALDRLMERYGGWQILKEEVFPKDARRGYFIGLDGRRVRIPGDSESSRIHLAMSGYLQNGEATVMKMATLLWHDKLKEYDAKLVNFVHDEWQVECPNNMTTALDIASLMASSLSLTGEALNMRCPLAGSYWNDDHKDYTIGTNWSVTH